MTFNSQTARCVILVLLVLAGEALVASGAPSRPVAGFHPVIVVEAVYPGASAQVVAETVAAPIETQVNGAEHLAHMVSRCTNDGRYTLLLSFDSAVDLNLTQVLIQNRVRLATPQLPSAVQNDGVTIRKLAPGASAVVVLISADASKDALSLGNYASIHLKDELIRLAGVGNVSLFGTDDKSLRVWLEPDKLRACTLSAGDVLKAIRSQGALDATNPADQKPVKSDDPFQFRLDNSGRLTSAEDVANIVLRAASDGLPIRLKDVARVELGSAPSRGELSFDGMPTTALAIALTPTAKPRDAMIAVRELMERLKKNFPPGVDYSVTLDLVPRGILSSGAPPFCLLAEPSLPPACSPQRIIACQNRYAEILRQTPGVAHVLSLPENPWALFRGGPCVVAIFNHELKEADWEKTRQAVRTQLEEVRSAALRLRDLSGPAGPRLDGYPIDFALRGTDAKAVQEFGDLLAARLNKSGRLIDVAAGATSAPRVEIEIDRTKAAALGVLPGDVSDVLQVAFGSAAVSDSGPRGRIGKLQVQLDAPDREKIELVKLLQVRSAKGQMVPLSNIVGLREVHEAASIDRVDLRPAATISANPANGVSLAEARWLCETLAEQVGQQMRLPAEYELVWLQEVPAAKPIPGELKVDAAPSPLAVTVAVPVSREVTDYEDFTGRIEASQHVDLRARVTGYLEKVLAKEGADVKKGDVLFVIDPRPYQALFDQAQANLKAAEALRDRSKRDLERMRAIGNAVPQSDVDAADAAYRAAAAQVDAAKAAVEIARMNLDWTTVRAPIDGLMTRTFFDPGNLVKADDTLLTKLINVDPVNVCFDVDERTLLRLEQLARKGKSKGLADAQVPVSVGVGDELGFPRHGVCNFVDTQVDPATGTILMRAVLLNKERLLRPGMFVRVRLPIGAPYQALLVPEEAIGSDLGQRFVYTVDDENKVVSRMVTVGAKQEGLRIIARGLRADERVIVEGHTRARSGQTVKPVTRQP